MMASTVDLEVNFTKTKILRTVDSTNDPKIQWIETSIEEVENFKCLSSVLARDGNYDMEARRNGICQIPPIF
ncbi:unnamed protein product [Soboliphyme baturini]|uniref:Ovule protein n=1 Tax=Soboliphyme baturini TaxID=241478 RepID=A0A183J0L7_9BILA|nr:unnamed protein product [Soboliphyme baturini]